MFLFDPVNLKTEKRFVLSNRKTIDKKFIFVQGKQQIGRYR